jgi:hypothetical protein
MGYQYPAASEKWDSNWLIIEATVDHPTGSWVAQDPCLLTFEVAELATWLEQRAHGQETEAKKSFIEPVIGFRSTNSTPTHKRLRVYFGYELSPPWSAGKVWWDNDTWLDFDLTPSELEETATALRQQLTQYPIRDLPE